MLMSSKSSERVRVDYRVMVYPALTGSKTITSRFREQRGRWVGTTASKSPIRLTISGDGEKNTLMEVSPYFLRLGD